MDNLLKGTNPCHWNLRFSPKRCWAKVRNNVFFREERKSFIRGKYISRNYVVQTCKGDPDALADELGQAIRSCDLVALLQLYGENADLAVPLPGYVRFELL